MQMLRINGMSFLDYWCARFIFDLLHYLVIMGIFSIFFLQKYIPVLDLHLIIHVYFILSIVLLIISAPVSLFQIFEEKFVNF